MNSPEAQPVTGLEYLKEALALDADQFVKRQRATWEALMSVEHHAIADLAYNHLHTLVRPRADLSLADRARLRQTSLVTAEFVIRGFYRGLAAAPNTLTAMARGAQSTVHGSERLMLAGSIRRPLISAGYDITPDVERELTYAIAALFLAALRKPAKMRPQPVRLGALRPDESHDVEDVTFDHDDVDWRTGEPLDGTCALEVPPEVAREMLDVVLDAVSGRTELATVAA